MNTVDALNVLGKALCGDSFEVKPGLTDAETILEIAKNYEGGGSGSGGGSSDRLVIEGSESDFSEWIHIQPNLSPEDFIGGLIRMINISDINNTSWVYDTTYEIIGVSASYAEGDTPSTGRNAYEIGTAGGLNLRYNPQTGEFGIANE